MALVAFLCLLAAGFLGARVVARDGRPAWPTRAVGPGGEPRPTRLLALLAVVLVPVASVGYFTSGSGFFWDDLVSFRQVQLEGFSWRYLLKPTSSHFAPGHRLGDWVLQEFFPMNFPVAQALMLVGFAATLVVFHRLLAELFGAGPVPLMLTLAYGASTIQVGTLNWWASGLDRLPATLLTFMSIIAYLRFFRTGARRSLALSVGAMAVALLFFVKPVLVPLYLVLLRVLVLSPGQPLRDTVGAALREWRVWLAYAVPVALYLYIYVSGYETLQEPSLGLFARYLSVSWFQVLGPGFLGVYIIPTSISSTLATAAYVAAQVVLVAVVVWSVRRRAAAWRAWVFLAVTLLVNLALVGFTRVGLFSPDIIAYVLFYHLEASYLFFLGLGAAFLPVRAAEPRKPADGYVRWRRPGNGARPTAVAALAAYLALSLWSTNVYRNGDTWFGPPARRYMDNAALGLQQAQGGRATVALVDGTVPYPVMPHLAGYFNSHSEMLPLVNDNVSFDATDPELFEVGDDGGVRPVRFVPEAGGDVTRLLAAGSLSVVEAATDDRTASLCLKSGATNAVVSFTPPEPRVGPRSYLAVQFSSQSRQFFGIAAELVGGGLAEPRRFVQVQNVGRVVKSVFPVDAASLQRLYLVMSPGSDVCLERLELGRLLPR